MNINDYPEIKSEISKYGLLLCRFCNGRPELKLESDSDGNVKYLKGYIECTECGICTHSISLDGYLGDPSTVEDLVKMWNGKVTYKEYSESLHERWLEKNCSKTVKTERLYFYDDSFKEFAKTVFESKAELPRVGSLDAKPLFLAIDDDSLKKYAESRASHIKGLPFVISDQRHASYFGTIAEHLSIMELEAYFLMYKLNISSILIEFPSYDKGCDSPDPVKVTYEPFGNSKRLSLIKRCFGRKKE